MIKTAHKLVQEKIDRFNGKVEPKNYEIRTGFSNVDKVIGGFQKGELIVIGGRPGMGKTTFGLQLSLQMSSIENKILFSNLDYNEAWMSNKLVSLLSETPLKDVQNNKIGDLDSILSSLEKVKLNIIQGLKNVNDLEINIEEDKPDVLIIDYVQLMTALKDEYEPDLSEVVKRLKTIALENNILVIALSQLNRNLEYRGGDKRPMIDDLRGTGALEEFADKVIMLYRPEYYDITEDCEGNSTIGLLEAELILNKTGPRAVFGFKINDSFTKVHSI